MPKSINYDVYCDSITKFDISDPIIVNYSIPSKLYIEGDVDKYIYHLIVESSINIKDLIFLLKLKYNFHNIRIYLENKRIT